MSKLSDMSVVQKQTFVMMLTSSAVLLLACAAFVTYDAITFGGELVEDVSVLADAIGDNCAAAIDFNDPAAATETLSAMVANDNIIYACVYTVTGEVFAEYHQDPESHFKAPAVEPPSHRFVGSELSLFRDIEHRKEKTGAIYVASDLKDMSRRLVRYLGIGGVVLAISLLVAFWISSKLQRLVVAPILNLAQLARTVATEKEYSVRAVKRGNDEVGQLVDGFNEMLTQIQAKDAALQAARDELEKRVDERTRELEAIHKKLMEASRRGGMAEIASNVLHNVGNVLNSVNVSTGLIVDSVKESRVESLTRVVALIQEHEADLGNFFAQGARGRLVLPHLVRLSDHFVAYQKRVEEELETLRRNVEHIKEIVAMQQSYATFGGVKEVVDVVNLVEDSIRMSEAALLRHHVSVTREYGALPPLNFEKHKILQILVNLVRNAKHACEDAEVEDKRMVVAVRQYEDRVHISVSDNGIGIPQENLDRIFNHGFTTKPDGHGFGLHSGALAAREMGGCLTVRSEGRGHGATFTLELPIVV